MIDLLQAAFLGIIEGCFEFLPVSSTGHLILARHFFGLDPNQFGPSFIIMIQLGAILALLSIYFGKLWAVAKALPSSAEARRFTIGVLVAFLPAVVVGLLAGDFIKDVLFNPMVVCISLIVGGIILLALERIGFGENAQHKDAMAFPLPMYAKIGCLQCLAMIPGVSRSGATIVAAMLMGADKRAAAEFSFFLAMPTMVGAFAYELMKNHDSFTQDSMVLIATGFAAAFVSALIVVKKFLDYVSAKGFALFGWWRVIIGTLGLIGLIVLA
jgi:undecaprenyl-diphosphatase